MRRARAEGLLRLYDQQVPIRRNHLRPEIRDPRITHLFYDFDQMTAFPAHFQLVGTPSLTPSQGLFCAANVDRVGEPMSAPFGSKGLYTEFQVDWSSYGAASRTGLYECTDGPAAFDSRIQVTRELDVLRFAVRSDDIELIQCEYTLSAPERLSILVRMEVFSGRSFFFVNGVRCTNYVLGSADIQYNFKEKLDHIYYNSSQFQNGSGGTMRWCATSEQVFPYRTS